MGTRLTVHVLVEVDVAPDVSPDAVALRASAAAESCARALRHDGVVALDYSAGVTAHSRASLHDALALAAGMVAA